ATQNCPPGGIRPGPEHGATGGLGDECRGGGRVWRRQCHDDADLAVLRCDDGQTVDARDEQYPRRRDPLPGTGRGDDSPRRSAAADGATDLTIRPPGPPPARRPAGGPVPYLVPRGGNPQPIPPGRGPFKAKTRVRIPSGTPAISPFNTPLPSPTRQCRSKKL